MKKSLVFVVAALLLSQLALAQKQRALNVVFDDAGFNYYNKSSGYIDLGSSPDGLVLHLQATADPNTLKYSFTKVKKLSRAEQSRLYKTAFDKSFVEQRHAQTQELKRIHQLTNLIERPHELSVLHKKAALDTVMAYYMTKLGEYGFTAQEAMHAPNVRVYTISNGTRQGRVTFTRTGRNVRVKIAGSFS